MTQLTTPAPTAAKPTWSDGNASGNIWGSWSRPAAPEVEWDDWVNDRAETMLAAEAQPQSPKTSDGKEATSTTLAKTAGVCRGFIIFLGPSSTSTGKLSLGGGDSQHCTQLYRNSGTWQGWITGSKKDCAFVTEPGRRPATSASPVAKPVAVPAGL